MKLFINERCGCCEVLVNDLLKCIDQSQFEEVELINVLPNDYSGIENVPVVIHEGIEYLGVKACLQFITEHLASLQTKRESEDLSAGSASVDRSASVTEQYERLLALRKDPAPGI